MNKQYKPIVMKSFFFLSLSFVLVIFSSCEIKRSPGHDFSSSDSTSISGLTGDSIKLVKTASINFKVRDVDQSARAVSALVQKLGGMVFDQSLQSNEQNSREIRLSQDSLMIISAITPHADVTVRVPVANLETFMFGVSDLGYYTGSSNLHIDDRSLLYLQNALKQKARTKILSRAGSKKDSAISATAIKVNDEAIDQQIANRSIDADVNYSLVTLSFFQNPVVRKETTANYLISEYQLPFSTRLADAMRAGWQHFLDFLLALAHLWMFIVVTIAVLLGYRYFRQKEKPAGDTQARS